MLFSVSHSQLTIFKQHLKQKDRLFLKIFKKWALLGMGRLVLLNFHILVLVSSSLWPFCIHLLLFALPLPAFATPPTHFYHISHFIPSSLSFLLPTCVHVILPSTGLFVPLFKHLSVPFPSHYTHASLFSLSSFLPLFVGIGILFLAVFCDDQTPLHLINQ